MGAYPANTLGLHDVVGNVWEWQGNLHTRPYDKSLALPTMLVKNATPALRGGSWNLTADLARCSFRNWNHPVNWLNTVGFRVVLSLAKNEI